MESTSRSECIMMSSSYEGPMPHATFFRIHIEVKYARLKSELQDVGLRIAPRKGIERENCLAVSDRAALAKARLGG